MKNNIISGLLALLLMTTLLIMGCGGNNTTATTPSAPAATTPKTTSPGTTTTTAPAATASGKTLSELLGMAAGINAVKYDMVMTVPGSPVMNQTVWIKGNKMRTEITAGGQNTIVLMDIDAKTMYTYMPAQNMALKMTWNPTTTSAVDDTEAISKYNPTIVGTDTIDGKKCTVVEYVIEGQTTKMWLWQDHGFPLKVEATTPQGKTTMEYKNIQFTDIPDSTFTLPAGVQIQQMPGA
jgi:outer membrane lipoprotein-sorting protein